MINIVMKHRSYVRGNIGEQVALDYYLKQDFEHLASRYRGSVGEVDIIVKKNNLIVAIEVKNTHAHKTIEELLKQSQINRICETLEEFVAINTDYYNFDRRIDCVWLENSIIKEVFTNISF